jgi:hypothetical protein
MMSATVTREAPTELQTAAPLIELTGVEKVYRTGKLEYPALRGVDLTIEEGEMVAIVNDLLDAIALASVPVLELSVQRTLVERPDRRCVGLACRADLRDRVHDDASSPPRLSRLRAIADETGRPTEGGETQPAPRDPGWMD